VKNAHTASPSAIGRKDIMAKRKPTVGTPDAFIDCDSDEEKQMRADHIAWEAKKTPAQRRAFELWGAIDELPREERIATAVELLRLARRPNPNEYATAADIETDSRLPPDKRQFKPGTVARAENRRERTLRLPRPGDDQQNAFDFALLALDTLRPGGASEAVTRKMVDAIGPMSDRLLGIKGEQSARVEAVRVSLASAKRTLKTCDERAALEMFRLLTGDCSLRLGLHALTNEACLAAIKRWPHDDGASVNRIGNPEKRESGFGVIFDLLKTADLVTAKSARSMERNWRREYREGTDEAESH
jgi:hypothetical protein